MMLSVPVHHHSLRGIDCSINIRGHHDSMMMHAYVDLSILVEILEHFQTLKWSQIFSVMKRAIVFPIVHLFKC